MALLQVVAEPVGGRLEHGERLGVGHFLRGVGAPRREGDLHAVPGLLRSLLDGCAAAQHDQVGERDHLPACLRAVELPLDPLQGLQRLRHAGRHVDVPLRLRREANARPVRATALVGVTVGRGRRPGGRDQLGDGQAGVEDLALERSDVRVVDQFVRDLGHRVLKEQLLLGNPRAEVPDDGSHVTVQQLVPRPGEGVGELFRVLVEALRDLLVGRIGDQRDVGRQHHRSSPLRRVVRLRHGLLRLGVLGGELVRTGRALRQLPLVVEQVLEVAVVPLDRIVGPGALEPAADRIAGFAAAIAARPAKALLLDAGTLGFGTFVLPLRQHHGLCRTCVRRQ